MDKQAKGEDKTLPFEPIDYSNYHTQGEVKRVFSPKIGSVLKRVSKLQVIQHYVVVNVFAKRTGVNSGLIDRIILEPVINPVILIENQIVRYKKSDYPLILSLTNHGQWWTKDMLKEYQFSFLDGKNEITVPISSPVPISLPIPLSRRSITDSKIYVTAVPYNKSL